MSVRSCLFSTMSNAFINAPINPAYFFPFSSMRLHAAICEPLRDRQKSKHRELSIHENLPVVCSEGAPLLSTRKPDRKTNHEVWTLLFRRRREHIVSRRQ